jgi:hypothetical protein
MFNFIEPLQTVREIDVKFLENGWFPPFSPCFIG